MEKKIIKWGVLGTGRIAGVMATALKVVENSELYAVGSRSDAKAQEFGSTYNIPKTFGSYEALVTDPDVDIIYIATPHNLHLQNALLAMNHGKHVLCEKPLAVNEKEVLQLIEKAKENNVFLMEALWSRFLPRIRKLKELVDSGEIGDITMLTAAFCFKSSHTPEQRHFNIDLCGGTILDIGIYNLFLSYLLLGKPLEISAMAALNNQGADTASSYTLKYPNEVLAVMHSSFLVDTPVVAEIHGSKASIYLGDRWFNLGTVNLKYHDANDEVFEFDTKANGYEYEAQEAVNCILTGKTQSDLWSWNNSLELVKIMDSIRSTCGITYTKHDK